MTSVLEHPRTRWFILRTHTIHGNLFNARTNNPRLLRNVMLAVVLMKMNRIVDLVLKVDESKNLLITFKITNK